MYSICKEYLYEVKSLLPVYGSKERFFLSKLKADVSDFCTDAEIHTKAELYEKYGNPEDIVYNYISSMDKKSLLKHIKTAKYIRALVVAIIAAALVATVIWGNYVLNIYHIAQRQEVVIAEQTIHYYTN